MNDIFLFLYEFLGEMDVHIPLVLGQLKDPDNRFMQLVLYLYSIESVLYTDISKASRNVDKQKLNNLGPFAAVLYRILMFGYECDRCRVDAAKMGTMDGERGPYGRFSQSFVTFSGVKMEESFWLSDYNNKVSQWINMCGTVHTTKNLLRALRLSKCEEEFK